MHYIITYRELNSVPRTGKTLEVAGGCPPEIVGLDLSGLRFNSIDFRSSSEPVLDLLLPGFVRRRVGRATPRFVDCSFDGMRCRHLEVDRNQFVRCSFQDVAVTALMGVVEAEFTDCTFSGRWDGRFSGKRRFVGNDLRFLRGADYMDGVDIDSNKLLRQDGTQILVRNQDPALVAAIEAAATDTPTHMTLLALLGQGLPEIGKLYLGQDWTILEEEYVPPALWGQLITIFNPGTS